MPKYRIILDMGRREEYVIEAESEEHAQEVFQEEQFNLKPDYTSEDVINFEIELEVE